MDMKTAEAVLGDIPLAVFVVDQDSTITLANAAARELFGRNPEGMNAVALLRQAPVLVVLDNALRDGQAGTARFLLSTQTGEVAYAFRAEPLKAGGAVLSFEDRSHLEEAELIRRDFVANISHEVQTPLTGILGFIETLRTTAKDDPVARDRFLEIMEQEARRMSRMVSDLLSLSRVEADERVRPRETVNLAGVVRSVVATLEGKLKDTDVTLVLVGADGDMPVMGVRDQLIQLYLNLIENAIKYGGEGKTITVTLTEIDHDRALRRPAIQVDVTDEGDGIDPLHLPRLTERFYRVDDHRSREKGGTGLGLAIVKHILNRHRGRLKIQSEQGVGSTFKTFIPKA